MLPEIQESTAQQGFNIQHIHVIMTIMLHKCENSTHHQEIGKILSRHHKIPAKQSKLLHVTNNLYN